MPWTWLAYGKFLSYHRHRFSDHINDFANCRTTYCCNAAWTSAITWFIMAFSICLLIYFICLIQLVFFSGRIRKYLNLLRFLSVYMLQLTWNFFHMNSKYILQMRNFTKYFLQKIAGYEHCLCIYTPPPPFRQRLDFVISCLSCTSTQWWQLKCIATDKIIQIFTMRSVDTLHLFLDNNS